MKTKFIFILIIMILPFSCDDEITEKEFNIQINNITNTYPVLISFSLTNQDLITSLEVEVNQKTITTIQNTEESPLLSEYTLTYSPIEGLLGDLNIKITGYYPGSGSKSSELTIDFNTSFTSINNDIVMINAGNQFLFTKYTITNEHYINYLNDILELLTNDENLIYNSSNQKIMNTNNSRIVFNDVDTLIVDNDTTITSASFSISDDEYINHPVTGVTWYGAENYANHFGWRLPTIDEWKYIASGDSINWKYPYLNQQANHSWVDTSQTNCNFNREQQNTTTNVEKFESNISYFGAVDIIGNVYELTSSQNEQSGLSIIVGGSYNSECKFIDENNDGIEDTNFQPPELCLQDSCFSSIWNDISGKAIGFRCIADIDGHNNLEVVSDCNNVSTSESNYNPTLIDQCGTCTNQISSIEDYFCLSDCVGFWNNQMEPENILDECDDCDGGLFFTCNDGSTCIPEDNICPNECAASYQCTWENITFPCNPKTSLTLGGSVSNLCQDECLEVLVSIENNVCDCNDTKFKRQYIDNDGDGNGDSSNDGILVCSNTPEDGYSDNNFDFLDDCPTDNPDCFGECPTILLNGEWISNVQWEINGYGAEFDECGVCGGIGETNYYQDADCDGLGNPSIVIEDECNPTIDENNDGICDAGDSYWVTDNTDPDDACIDIVDECGVCSGDNSTCSDCAGIPNGTGVVDECGVCDGPGSIYECGCSDIPEQNCDCNGNVLDCNGDCGGSAEIDCSGQCAGGLTNIEAYDICGCFESEALNYWCNDDGQCPVGETSVPSEELLDCQDECISSTLGSYIAINPYTFDNGYYVYNDLDNCCFTGCTDNNAANYDVGCLEDLGTCQYTNYLKIGEITNSTIELLINSDQDVGGFQFALSGITLEQGTGFGGLCNDNNLTVTTGPNGVLGLSFTGNVIPSTNGQELTLTTINYIDPDGSTICLPSSELILSNASGSSLDDYIIYYENTCP